MLTTVNGYIDGNRVIVDESVADWQGSRVIVTILDSINKPARKADKNTDDESRKAAAEEIAGLWKGYGIETSVDDTVRNMRRGRSFDI